MNKEQLAQQTIKKIKSAYPDVLTTKKLCGNGDIQIRVYQKRLMGLVRGSELTQISPITVITKESFRFDEEIPDGADFYCPNEKQCQRVKELFGNEDLTCWYTPDHPGGHGY